MMLYSREIVAIILLILGMPFFSRTTLVNIITVMASVIHSLGRGLTCRSDSVYGHEDISTSKPLVLVLLFLFIPL